MNDTVSADGSSSSKYIASIRAFRGRARSSPLQLVAIPRHRPQEREEDNDPNEGAKSGD